jgi:acyl-CoA thioesterase-1
MKRFAAICFARRLAGLPAQVVLAALLVNLCMPAASGEPARPVQIVAFGDSLTAGLGVAPQDAFPEQLQRALRSRGVAAEVINAGVSGDTSGAGLQRLEWAVPASADAVILELGANDALRGIDPKLTRAALEKIVKRLQAKGLGILIAGMRAPQNWGDAYARDFDSIFPELAAASGSMLYPFFLDGVAMQPDLNQADGLHPTAKGVAVIVERMLPKVLELIERVEAKRNAAASRG